MSAMTRGGDDKGDAMIESYKELVSLASEGIEEYLAVIAELLDASILLNGMPSEISKNADKWAEEIATEVSQKMEEQNVIPHYYIAALIEKLHKVGVESFTMGFNEMACRKFQEAYS